jgi:hypothetical protein
MSSAIPLLPLWAYGACYRENCSECQGVENIGFTTYRISRSNKFCMKASLSTTKSNIIVVYDYFRRYPSTDGVKDGRTSDFVNENFNKEQSIVVPPP